MYTLLSAPHLQRVIDALFQILLMHWCRGLCVRCGVHDRIIAYVPRHLFSPTSVLTLPFWDD